MCGSNPVLFKFEGVSLQVYPNVLKHLYTSHWKMVYATNKSQFSVVIQVLA